MRTFAQKPNATQQTTSAKSTKPGRAHFGQHREVNSILHLQRTIGNQAVQPILFRDRLFESSDINQATDHSLPSLVSTHVHEAITSTSQPLDSSTREFMEQSFGHDFSHVKVHTDTKAVESSREADARAYTIGSDVVFGEGEYAPGTRSGRSLIAHELAHVVQQQQTNSSTLELVKATDPSEQEATAASSAIMSGNAVPSLQAKPAQIARQEDITESPATPLSGNSIYPNVKVWINSFIPHDKVKGPPGSECFAGDNRSFSNAIHASSRTHQEIEVRPDLTPTINWKHIGTSHEVDCATGRVLRSDTASTDEVTNGPISGSRTSADVLISFSGAASNPLVFGAPAIDFHAFFRINLLTRQCDLEIEHDGFPAYEAYVTADGGAGVTVYTYDPTAAGEGISALFPPMDKSGDVHNISF